LVAMQAKARPVPNTYVVSPPIEARFPLLLARSMLREALEAAFGGGAAYSTDKTKAVVEGMRDQFKGARSHCHACMYARACSDLPLTRLPPPHRAQSSASRATRCLCS
jgi:hypothetical protein